MSKIDINLINQALSSVGFPIICCYFMYTYINKKDQQINKIMEMHKEETTAMSEAIEKNNQVMENLLEKLKREDSNE